MPKLSSERENTFVTAKGSMMKILKNTQCSSMIGYLSIQKMRESFV